MVKMVLSNKTSNQIKWSYHLKMVSQDLLVVRMKMVLLLRVLQLIQVAYLKKMFQLVKIIQANKMIKPENGLYGL